MTDSAPGVEHLDVVDEVGRYLRTAPRDEVHERGEWHRVFHCQIVTLRDGVPTAVLQQRSPSKAAFPGLIDISAAGHLAAGETPLDGVRELEEELGIAPAGTELVPLGVRRLADDSGEGTLNCELTSVYLLRDDRPLADYVLALDEVEAVLDVPIADLLALLNGGPPISVHGVAAAGHLDAREVTTEVTLGDLVPSAEYWVVLMVMAQRFLADQRPLAV
ncbi:NUDIX hydrolase [Candidatus Poriferisodalis sp.]|uniref:NUDIX hydrolase n=1 Tax=Candidatus Poriferisodalis sp. TaxID=3101277 RepID=UPI003B010B6F